MTAQDDLELLQRAFKSLNRAEGYFAAASYKEATSPPFKNGRAFLEWVEIREVLADLQKRLRK